jgi:alpha-galactosidase
MIRAEDNVFYLETADTMYIFRITKYGHPEHIYYGARLVHPDIEALAPKRSAQIGSTVAYDREDSLYCLDTICFEWSGIGKGDYRYSPAEIIMPDGGFVTDFVYVKHAIQEGILPMTALPSSLNSQLNKGSTLLVTLQDKATAVLLTLVYTVFEECNVITRRVTLENNGNNPLTIRRLLSFSFDMPNSGFSLITFDGDWAKEARRHDRKLQYGIFVNENRTGASGNKHNPGFLLCENNADENHGRVYGFNLVYSGNHFGFSELNSHELVRIGLGISPHCFEWKLNTGEKFETPEAVLSFSENGFNGLSRNFHSFINDHIVPKEWQGKERPVLYNCWEPCFFNYNQRKLTALARRAKKLGMELFVLDDGWFRDNDKEGLGDYTPKPRKFPRGLKPFAEKLRRMGLGFGIWFEPEMISEDSKLFRSHPEYAVHMKDRASALGRNQLVLDLCNPAVRDYITASVGKILDDTEASYVKWDMNRHISEFWSDHIRSPGEFFHRYILGLYDILKRIFSPRPHILFESCSSGGNRFDLGMLCFSPQIWASDNTDPVERLRIQGGLSYLYPQSVMGAHVSDAPHQQTLRDTPLSTRYNAAVFGCLGYELDLRFLTRVEKQEIRDQIIFYKANRKTLQFGSFERVTSPKSNKIIWLVRAHGKQLIAAFFQTQAGVSEGPDSLRINGLEPETIYRITTRAQKLYIKRFGGLVKHILPVTLDPTGFIMQTVNRFYALTDCVESYECTGSVLAAGVFLNNQFMGSYYNNKTRLLGDYGSNLYTIDA